MDRVAPVGNGRYSKQCVFDPAMRRVFRRSCFFDDRTWHMTFCRMCPTVCPRFRGFWRSFGQGFVAAIAACQP